MPGEGGQVGRGARPEDGGTVLRRERAQADPVPEVAVEAAGAAALEALAREYQVDTEAATGAADGQEHVEHVGARLEQLAELVHDHDEIRHRREVGSRRAQRAVLPDLLHVGTGRPQQLLTAFELTAQCRLHAIDEGEVVARGS